MKILSAVIYFDLATQSSEKNFTFRDLQDHFLMDEEPFSFSSYTNKLAHLYKVVKENLIR